MFTSEARAVGSYSNAWKTDFDQLPEDFSTCASQFQFFWHESRINKHVLDEVADQIHNIRRWKGHKDGRLTRLLLCLKSNMSIIFDMTVNFWYAANVEAAEAAVENGTGELGTDVFQRHYSALSERV